MGEGRARTKYKTGPAHIYWPVYDEDGQVIALCPSAQLAQLVAAALARPHKGDHNGT